VDTHPPLSLEVLHDALHCECNSVRHVKWFTVMHGFFQHHRVLVAPYGKCLQWPELYGKLQWN